MGGPICIIQRISNRPLLRAVASLARRLLCRNGVAHVRMLELTLRLWFNFLGRAIGSRFQISRLDGIVMRFAPWWFMLLFQLFFCRRLVLHELFPFGDVLFLTFCYLGWDEDIGFHERQVLLHRLSRSQIGSRLCHGSIQLFLSIVAIERAFQISLTGRLSIILKGLQLLCIFSRRRRGTSIDHT